MPAIDYGTESKTRYFQVTMSADAYRQLKQNVGPGEILSAEIVNLTPGENEAVARAARRFVDQQDYATAPVVNEVAEGPPSLVRLVLQLQEKLDRLTGIVNDHDAHLHYHDGQLKEHDEALLGHNLDSRLGRLI